MVAKERREPRKGSIVGLRHALFERFCRARDVLARDPSANYLSSPLSFWVMPDDRLISADLMGRPLRDLLQIPFLELYAIPGVGDKKVRSFLTVLERAAQRVQSPAGDGHVGSFQAHAAQDGAVAPVSGSPVTGALGSLSPSAASPYAHEAVDLRTLSESTWAQWRDVVRQYRLEEEPLGRFARSLHSLSRPMWDTPLGTYVDLTLDRMRQLKTHGSKRIAAIADVFQCIHSLLSSRDNPHLQIYLVPRFVYGIERWGVGVLRNAKALDRAEVQRGFAEPLLDQIKIDAPVRIVERAEQCLVAGACLAQYRQQSGMPRAHVYEMIEYVGHAMRVRWPNGPAFAEAIGRRLKESDAPEPAQRLFRVCSEICFATSLERIAFGGRASISPTPPGEGELLPPTEVVDGLAHDESTESLGG